MGAVKFGGGLNPLLTPPPLAAWPKERIGKFTRVRPRSARNFPTGMGRCTPIEFLVREQSSSKQGTAAVEECLAPGGWGCEETLRPFRVPSYPVILAVWESPVGLEY